MSERSVRLLAPEGTEIGLTLASVGERAIAYVLDVLLSQLVLIVFVVIGAIAAVVTTSEHVVALIVLGAFVIRHGYFLFFETRFQGSTPGKRLLRLRVVSRDGAQLGLDAIVARNVMRDLEVMLPLVLLVAPEAAIGRAPAWLAYPAVAWLLVVALLPVISRERTRAGDLVAGTVVVRVPRTELLRDEARGTKATRLRFTREQLAVYGEHELETLAQLLRSAEAGKADDDDLRVVATTIARRIGFEGNEPQRTPAVFLRAFYRDQRAELERNLVLGKRIADKHERTKPTTPRQP
ncbi:RDD family protein [Sorangium sp. So ce1097]|uniref:RDD family protein n=1 Tax=Sorangium sp. So ce1097 TaxID=3133330 RepID=UPI003F607B11